MTGKYKIRITSVIRLIQKQFKIKDKDINFQNIKNKPKFKLFQFSWKGFNIIIEKNSKL